MKRKPKILAIIGARPQFIKHFPFEKACEDILDLKSIHTGQHYDANMSDVFYNELGMNKPDFLLNVGSGNHGTQTAHMMVEIENIFEEHKPDGVVVYGDTNSTLAGAVVAAKLHIPIFHIEAGLRSYNKEMPEEVNRVLTDHISSLLFTPSAVAVSNLSKEGIADGVHIIGDIMKDVVRFVQKNDLIKESFVNEPYYYVTLHRPYNTDSKERLNTVLDALNILNKKVVMALHPRTKNLMKGFGIEKEQFNRICFIEPQSYFNNLTYLHHADGLITDSGGMQKEAYWLQKKCITIRKETEWIETVEHKGNILLFNDLDILKDEIERVPPLWDENLYGNGFSAEKIVKIISEYYNA